SHVFELQGASELKVAEKKYLPTYGQDTNAIILAASRGSKLGELTSEIPKTLLKVNGKPILHTLVDEFNQMGIKDISVVQGYGKEFITIENITSINNPLFDETKELYSLSLAMDQIKG